MNKVALVLLALLVVAGALLFWIFAEGGSEAPAPPLTPQAEAPKMAPADSAAPAPAEAQSVQQVEAVTTPDEATWIVFQGVVQSAATGAPVEGATVRLRGNFDPDITPLPKFLKDATPLDKPEVTTTDSDGAFQLRVKHVYGFNSITCEARGFARASKPGEDFTEAKGGEEIRVDFSLQPGTRVFGHVTDAASAAPIEGARVVISAVAGNMFERMRGGPPVPYNATSGKDGAYEVVGLPAGSFNIRAGANDNTLSLPKGDVPTFTLAVSQERQIDLALRASAIVQGTVTAAGGGTLPEGASVTCMPASPVQAAFSSDSFLDMMTSPMVASVIDGHYRIAGLERATSYALHASAEGFASAISAPFSIAEGEGPRTINLELTKGSVLHGIARYEDGAPAAEVDLSLMPKMENLMSGAFDQNMSGDHKTDAKGNFTIEHVSQGGYRLFAQKDAANAFNPFGGKDNTVELDVDGVHDVSNIELTVSGAPPHSGNGIITGHVLDSTGAPVAQINVSAAASTTGDRGSAGTKEDGSFRIEGLSEESYVVSVHREGESASEEKVAPGSDITLRLMPVAKVAGTVVDAAGDPVAECTVRLESRASGLAAMFDPKQMAGMLDMGRHSAKTDEFGAFEIDDPEPGHYVVKALSSARGNGESEAFDLAENEGKEGLRIQLKPGVRFSGTVADTKGQGIVGARLALSAEQSGNFFASQMSKYMPAQMRQSDAEVRSGDNGAFEFTNVAPGSYRLGVSADGFAGTNEEGLAFEEGHDTTGYKVTLSEGGCLAGKAVVHGESKAGLMVQAIGDGDMQMTQTGEDGRFEICSLAPGSYMVNVMDPAGMMSGSFSAMMPTMRKAEVNDGETTEVDFGAAEDGGSVQGVIHGKLGKMTTVSLKKQGAPAAPSNPFDFAAQMAALDNVGGTTMANPDGTFLMEDVSPGNYTLQVFSVDFDPAHPDIAGMMERQNHPDIEQNITVAPRQTLTLDLQLPVAAP